jgi:chromosomal replication initiator protein
VKAGAIVERVDFIVPKPRAVPIKKVAASRRKEGARCASRPSDEGENWVRRLMRALRFDSFVVGKPNELAHAAARRVAEGGPVTFNPLFLYGGVGLGKTHLMHAIAHEMQARQPQLRVLYLSAEQFMYRFIQALRDKQIMDFKELFRSVDVLMVDDVQFIAGKDSTQEEFFHTFNALVDQNKRIVISADRAPGEIKDLEDRIKSRLQCGLVVDLHPTDYELRLGILQQKAEIYRGQYQGLKLANGVLEFLAHRITTNVRVLEGALTRLFAFASLWAAKSRWNWRRIALPTSCALPTARSRSRKFSARWRAFQHPPVGHDRPQADAHHCPAASGGDVSGQADDTRARCPKSVAAFGGRDHTTIMHGVRVIEEMKLRPIISWPKMSNFCAVFWKAEIGAHRAP